MRMLLNLFSNTPIHNLPDADHYIEQDLPREMGLYASLK